MTGIPAVDAAKRARSSGATTPDGYRHGSRHDSRHGPVAQLLLAWAPLSGILVVYAAAAWVNGPIDVGRAGAHRNRLGAPVHLTAAAHADRFLFGVVPPVWLQSLPAGGAAHWYDVVASLVYLTHVVSIPLVTAVVWFGFRDRFASWLLAVGVFVLIGTAGYVLFPSAPPWLASEQGAIGVVHRTSDLGWHYLHLSTVGRLIGSAQSDSNPVAAMPSLHAGGAALIAAFLWPVVGRAWRATLASYALLMAVTLVYTGEHYVVDVLAGVLTAGVAVAVSRGCSPARVRSHVGVHREAPQE